MRNEINESHPTQQMIFNIPAGTMPFDGRIEFFADRENRKVFFISNGITDEFRLLGKDLKNKVFLQMIQDNVAYNDLKHLPYEDALERYVFCVYGSMDHTADMNENGRLGRSDNFNCGIPACNCRNWKSKLWTINGHNLKGRMLDVLMAYRRGSDDKNVAAELGISMPTLNIHKRRLFEVFSVGNKTELVLAAIQTKIFQ